VTSDDCHRGGRLRDAREQIPDQDISGDVGKAEVAEDRVEAARAGKRQRLSASPGLRHVRAVGGQQRREQFTEIGVVLDDEDA
jgi:hypothetical protein